MKAFKKYIFLFILILIGSYFWEIKGVEAEAINWEGVKVECIYEDGGAYSLSKGIVNRVTYNLVGVDTTKSATTSSNIFLNVPIDESTHKCQPVLKSFTLTEKDEDDNKISRSYYKFVSDDNVQFQTEDFNKTSWWDLFGKWVSEIQADIANKNYTPYNLVSERYILTDLAGEPDYTLTYKEESKQATGSDNYAYIMAYSDGTYLLKTREKTTLLETGKDHFSGISVNNKGEVIGINDKDKICINNPEAFSTTDSTGVASHYFNDGQIRYGIKISATDECSGEYNRSYVLFNTGLGSGDAPDDELCESIMPETSKILKRVIKIAQIVIPVLMIVLCGLDIGKIVVSGNIEEELPKQKKKITARLIVGVSFFFLPLVVLLTINLLKESGAVEAEDIKSIECLFE